jgi:hypothetical protein
MEQNTPLKADSCSATETFPSFYEKRRFINSSLESATGPFPKPDESDLFITLGKILVLPSNLRLFFRVISSL